MMFHAALSVERDNIGPQRRGGVVRDKLGVSAYAAIDFEIVVRHASGRKAFLETSPHRAPIKSDHLGRRADCLVHSGHNPPRETIIDDFWNRAATKSKNWRSARHRFDHEESKWFRPIDWKEQCERLSEEFCFVAIVDFSYEVYAWAAEQRCNHLTKIGLVHSVDFGGDFLSGRPNALAIAIARSRRLSGEMRPRKAK